MRWLRRRDKSAAYEPEVLEDKPGYPEKKKARDDFRDTNVIREEDLPEDIREIRNKVKTLRGKIADKVKNALREE